jgi:ribose transport system permease protein
MSAVTGPAAAERPSPWARLARVQARLPVLQLAGTIIIFVYGAATLDGLSSWTSIKLILVLSALAGLSAAGQTLLILMGGFDLSVAGYIVASALAVTELKDKWGLTFGEALIIDLVVIGSLGAASGYLCHRLKIQPLIVTLATGTIALGLVQTQGGLTFGAAVPPWLIRLSTPSAHTFGVDVPPLVIIWIVVAVALTLYLRRTASGRRLMATGANPRAATYSLIQTRKVWVAAFAFSALCSAILGLFVSGFGGSVTVASGDPYVFLSVVAVVVGGTVFGGPGGYLRSVIGALFITVLDIVLVGHGATTGDQEIVYGVAILIVVGLYGGERPLRDRV